MKRILLVLSFVSIASIAMAQQCPASILAEIVRLSVSKAPFDVGLRIASPLPARRVVSLVLSVLASHPTLTPGGLASYAWWSFSDFASAGWNAFSAIALQSAQASGALSLFDGLAAAPYVVAGGVLLYVAACALALRVLYKHVFASNHFGRRYAQVSVS